MKTKIFLLLMLLVSASFSYADDDGPQPLPLNPIPGSGDNRPRTPVAPLPTCEYDGTYLYIDFTYSEGDAEIQVTNGGVVSTYHEDTASTIVIPVGTLVYGATIIIETEDENTYIAQYLN